MKYLLPLLTLSLLFSQELEVEGDLKVTGIIENNSLQNIISQQQEQISALQELILQLQNQFNYLSNQLGYQPDCNGIVGGTAILDVNGGQI